MKRIRQPRSTALIFSIAVLYVILTAQAPYCAAAASADPEAYLTVLSRSAARVSWPEYNGAGYVYAVQVKIDESGFETLAELPLKTTSYGYTGIKAQSVYVFRIILRSQRGNGDEAYCNEIIYRPQGVTAELSGVSAVQVSESEIRISWMYGEGAAYDTEILRRLGGDGAGGDSDYAVIATTSAGTNSFRDFNVSPDTLYRYRVRAVYGYAAYSGYRETAVRSGMEPPQITEIYAATQSSVYLAWTQAADTVRCQIERALKGGAEFSAVTSVTGDRCYFVDYGVVPGERYIYRIKSIGKGGAESLYSETAEVAAIYINAPQALTAVSIALNNADGGYADGGCAVLLSWNDAGGAESSYEIWRYDEQYPGWTPLGSAGRNAVSYMDTLVGPGEKYIYKIRARSAEYAGFSGFSAEAQTVAAFIPAPSGLKQTSPAGSIVSLSWKDNSADESRFIIERREGSAGQWKEVASAGANSTERAGLSAPQGSPWYFRVGAYSSEYRSIAYCEPLRADNGFNTYIRGSSYRTDGNVPANVRGVSPASKNADQKTADARLDAAALKELGKRNIVNISGGNIAGGGEPVTRGEFAAMLVRVLKIEEKAIGSFGDVTLSHPYYAEIMKGARLGFLKPEDGDLFYPDRIITRAEMAVFVYDSLLARGTPLPAHGPDALLPFPDAAEVPPSLLKTAYAVFGEKIMIGIGITDGGRIIGIGRDSTREQAALVIYRYMLWVDKNY